MDNVLQNQELRLAAFGEYLLKHRLVKPEHARFHVFWVRKFLAQHLAAPVSSISDRIALFMEALQVAGNHDWQVEQAERALRLYFVNFMKNQSSLPAPATSVRAGADDRLERVILFLKDAGTGK